MSLPSHITNIYELLDEEFDPSRINPLPVKEATKAPVKSAPAKTTTQGVKSNNQSASGKTGSPRDSRRGDRQNAPRSDRNQGQQEGGFQQQQSRGPRQDRPRQEGYRNQGEGRQEGFRNQGEGRQERQNRPPRQPRNESTWGEGNTEQNTDANEAQVRHSYDRDQPRDGESRGDQRRRAAPAGGFAGNKRYNDRRSGTGRPPREEKRQGRGRGNWGPEDGSEDPATTEEAKEIGEGEAKTHIEEEKEKVEEEKRPETEEEKIRREAAEKEAKQITLTDYLKQQEEKRKASANLKTLEARKANEGVDASQQKQWTNQSVKKEEIPTNSITSAEEKKVQEKKVKSTVRLDTIFSIKEQPRKQYDDDRRDGRDRRDRRDNRDRSDRPQGDRPPRDRKSAPRNNQQSEKQTTNATGGPLEFSDSSFPVLNK